MLYNGEIFYVRPHAFHNGEHLRYIQESSVLQFDPLYKNDGFQLFYILNEASIAYKTA